MKRLLALLAFFAASCSTAAPSHRLMASAGLVDPVNQVAFFRGNPNPPPPGAVAIISQDGRTLIQQNSDGTTSPIIIGAAGVPVLPASWAASWMPLGDSQTAGFTALGAQPSGIGNSTGADGTGTYRRYLLQAVANLGIAIPNTSWTKGTFQSTDPNIPVGNNHHEGVPGYQCVDINTHFATWWASAGPAAAIALMCGTNDWQVWLNSHAGDYAGAAAFAQTNLVTLLATIKSVAGANVPVGFITPPTGATHLTEAGLFVPLAKATIAAAVAGGQHVYLMCDGTAIAGSNDTSGFMDADDIHLNEIGQQVLAGCVLRGMLNSPY